MQQKQLSGIFYAAFASLWWGVVGTIFFKFVSFASFIELTVHRTIWTAVLLILSTSFYKKWPEFIKIFKSFYALKDPLFKESFNNNFLNKKCFIDNFRETVKY